MAYSFFYGYLKLILPNTGGADKDLHELLLKYEDIEYVKFAVYKLFILIPLSGYCPPSLENGNNPTIEESKVRFRHFRSSWNKWCRKWLFLTYLAWRAFYDKKCLAKLKMHSICRKMFISFFFC